MGSYAWYYNAGNGTYYWTYAYVMSATQFAREVSVATGEKLTAADISATDRQAGVERIKRFASTLIYLD